MSAASPSDGWRGASSSQDGAASNANGAGDEAVDLDAIRRGDEALDLDAIRRGIEAVDRALIALLAERSKLSLAAAAAKRAAGLPTLDPPREAAVVRRAAEHARTLDLPTDTVRDIFWQIIALCRSAQTERGERGR